MKKMNNYGKQEQSKVLKMLTNNHWNLPCCFSTNTKYPSMFKSLISNNLWRKMGKWKKKIQTVEGKLVEGLNRIVI